MSKTNFTIFFFYSLDKHSNLLAVYYSSELVGGVYNFLGSVLPLQGFEMVDQCYSLVTAQGVIGQAKESTSLRHEGRSTPKKRCQSICLGFLLLYTLSAPHPCPPACTMQIVLAKNRHVYFTWSSHSGLRIFFCSIFSGFSHSLPFSHCYFGFPFPILTT